MRIGLIILMLAAGCAARAERLGVSADGARFENFTPWGFNYDRDYKSRLLEEYWIADWATVEQDFREMKALGANVIRIHLQFHQFMDGPDRPNKSNLAQLKRLLRLAEQVNLRLDITGLASYRKQSVPRWYDDLDEQARWEAQANFWSAIAKACSYSPAVFCYDLMNEPVVPTKKTENWLVPIELGGFSYVQHIVRDPAGRDRMQIARDWTAQMIAAIRKHDRQQMITIGLLPWSVDLAKTLVPQLDFIAVHMYPDGKKIDAELALLAKFDLGKPLLIEETFPLKASMPEFRDFLVRCRPPADGVIGFYWGKSPGELKDSREINDYLLLRWLELFQELHPAAQPPAPSPSRH